MSEKDKAKEWIIGNEVCGLNDVVYGVPSCPTCGEPTYSMERCPFCNQLLKEPEARAIGLSGCPNCGNENIRKGIMFSREVWICNDCDKPFIRNN